MAGLKVSIWIYGGHMSVTSQRIVAGTLSLILKDNSRGGPPKSKNRLWCLAQLMMRGDAEIIEPHTVLPCLLGLIG